MMQQVFIGVLCWLPLSCVDGRDRAVVESRHGAATAGEAEDGFLTAVANHAWADARRYLLTLSACSRQRSRKHCLGEVPLLYEAVVLFDPEARRRVPEAADWTPDVKTVAVDGRHYVVYGVPAALHHEHR